MNDLVKADRQLPSQEEVDRHLDRLQAEGDVQALDEVARQAHAHQEYERREEAVERATFFGRIKVMAEARIGSIDLELYPAPKDGHLDFNGHVVSRDKRVWWRTLGAGLQTGQLESAIALVEQDGEPVTTQPVVRELRYRGVHYVWAAPLLKRYRQAYKETGLSIAELERRGGGLQLGHAITRPGTKPVVEKLRRPTAVAAAKVLGLNPTELQGVPLARKRAPKRTLRQPRRLTGGRLDKAYTLIRQALQELEAATDGTDKWGTEDVWNHLHKAEDAIGHALKRAKQ